MATERQREARKQARQIRERHIQQLQAEARARALAREQDHVEMERIAQLHRVQRRAGPRGYLAFVGLLLGLAQAD